MAVDATVALVVAIGSCLTQVFTQLQHSRCTEIDCCGIHIRRNVEDGAECGPPPGYPATA